MLKDLKMGTKMVLGFGIVIVLVIVIGGLAVLNMRSIQVQSNSLRDEYVPQVSAANEVERQSLKTMYAMRGYTLSFDETYYKESEATLADVNKYLTEAHALATKYSALTELKAGVAAAEEHVADYAKLRAETRVTIGEILEGRKTLDAAAAAYMKECAGFLKSQDESLDEEIAAKATQAKLLERVGKIALANEIVDIGNDIRIHNWKAQALVDYTIMEEGIKLFDGVGPRLDTLLKVTRQEENRRQIAAVRAAGDAYKAGMTVVLENYRKLAELAVSRGVAATAVLTAGETVTKAGIGSAQKVADLAAGIVSSASVVIIVGLIVALGLAIAVSLLLTRMITSSLGKGVDFAEEIALGDLDAELDVEQKDEIGILANALRKMQKALRTKAKVAESVAGGDLSIAIDVASDKDGLGKSLLAMKGSLNDLLSQVQTAVDQVGSAAGQVSQSSQALSQGATEQASSLEQITSSLTEVNSQSRQNADSAGQANILAKKAAEDANDGNEKMAGLYQAMERINKSAGEIKKVVKVIDDIAFQINLLALNANVEAARAGKFGKGFAVVADEVRNLAVKSAQSVKETTGMVEDAIRAIEQGSAAAGETGKQLEAITAGAGKVADLLGEIALASKEQAQAIEQVNSGIEQIEQVTQANTASAEESAAAAEELASQAQQLRGMVARFKLDGTNGSGATAGNRIAGAAPRLVAAPSIQ